MGKLSIIEIDRGNGIHVIKVDPETITEIRTENNSYVKKEKRENWWKRAKAVKAGYFNLCVTTNEVMKTGFGQNSKAWSFVFESEELQTVAFNKFKSIMIPSESKTHDVVGHINEIIKRTNSGSKDTK